MPREVSLAMTSGISREKGFSIVELLVVFTVIAVLTGFAAFGMSGFREGHALRASRDEAAVLVEKARSLAIYSGEEMTLRLDPASRSFWVEDKAGARRADPERIERGVQVEGPANLTFKATGGLGLETAQVYTFRAERSGKAVTLRIHAKTGRAEKEEV
jgi:general secretion pathway protein H